MAAPSPKRSPGIGDSRDTGRRPQQEFRAGDVPAPSVVDRHACAVSETAEQWPDEERRCRVDRRSAPPDAAMHAFSQASPAHAVLEHAARQIGAAGSMCLYGCPRGGLARIRLSIGDAAHETPTLTSRPYRSWSAAQSREGLDWSEP